jgi:signal transduction histidine kinase
MCKDSREQMEKEEALRKLLLCISRELREPANSVLAAKALLAQRASVSDDAEAAFWVQAIGASCRLLLGIVTNVLSMRVIESGELEMLPVEYDPSSAVNDVLQVCRLGCSSRVEWRNEDEPLPRIVLADRTFFCQILQNLVRCCCCGCVEPAHAC